MNKKLTDIESFINNWNEKAAIGNKKFDTVFHLDGIPLWWFFRRLIVGHVLPKSLNLSHYLKNNSDIPQLKKIKGSVSAVALSKFILHREKMKFLDIRKKRSFSSKKKALVLSYSNHISQDNKIFRLNKIVEEIKKLKNDDFESLLLFVDPLSRKDHKKLSKHDNIYRYKDREIFKKAQKLSYQLHKNWSKIEQKEKTQILTLKNKSLGEVSLWPYLKYALDFYFSKEFLFVLILYYETFKKVIKKENIKVVVVTGTSSIFEKCLLAAAKQAGLPAVFINHGLGKETGNPDLIHKTIVAVFSKKFKERYIRYGVKKENISIVGPVVYDEIFDYMGSKSKKSNKKIIFATGPFAEVNFLTKKDYFNKIDSILKYVNQIKNVEIAIKLHPRERYENDYKKLIKKRDYRNVKIYSPTTTRNKFYNLIKWCDVFCHFGSNAALEAMIIDRPVITINIMGKNLHFKHWLHKSKSCVHVEYGEDIKNKINFAVKNDSLFKQKRMLKVKQNCGIINGQASQRTVSIISKLINKTD